MDDSEDEDEAEADLIFAEKFTKQRVPKPPTPPKVLNENKIIEKLQSFSHQGKMEEHNSTSSHRKSVVLIDANPEFLVTERDVLSTLKDNNVNPEKIQRIYRHLFQKSKDMSLCEAVQVGAEIGYTHRLKQIDRGISAVSLNYNVKEQIRGILRQESAQNLSNKTFSSQTSYHRYDCMDNNRDQVVDKYEVKDKSEVKDKPETKDKSEVIGKSETKNKNEVKDKYEKEKIAECDCKKPSSKKHNSAKKEVLQDITKISDEAIDYFNEQINVHNEKNININEEKLPVIRLSNQEFSKSLTSEILEYNSGGKSDFTNGTKNNDSYKITLTEENEEIEEEIETDSEELSSKSRQSSNVEKENVQIDNEEDENKDNSDNDDNDDSSIISKVSHESFKYSDDFSNVTDSSSNSDGNQSDEASLQDASAKVKNGYPPIEDYVKERDVSVNKRSWKVKSSSESSSSGTSMVENVPLAESQRNSLKPTGFSRIIKKRTSVGLNGLKSMSIWNDIKSDISGDFFAARNSSHKYCSPKCRESETDKSCSEACKFVRTNCDFLSSSMNCLQDEQNLESSSSSSD